MSPTGGWQYDGSVRPPFADTPAAGCESVWDYPRPPRLAADSRLVEVRQGELALAVSRRALRVLETASPPSFYLPPDDVMTRLLRPAPGASHCEWKGRARYWSLADGAAPIAWSYDDPTPAFSALRGWFSFYPARVACHVDGERVRAQPGGFYGGWLTREIAGPVKGTPGTGHW